MARGPRGVFLMARAPILEKYASAAAQGDRDREAVRRGLLDRAEVIERHSASVRIALGEWALRHGRRWNDVDPSRLAAVRADLRDDGMPDWAYWLDKPERRYRLRPWRSEDGPPWSYQTPCVTVTDSETGRRLRGSPAGAFLLQGQHIKLEDTDECCAALFVVSAKRKRHG